MIYYTKQVIEGKITSIKTYDYEPNLGNLFNEVLITENEYNELYQKYLDSDRTFLTVIKCPKFYKISNSMIFTKDILSNTYTVPSIPYNTIDLIIYIGDLYVNGVVDFSTNLFNGFIALKDNNNEITTEGSNSISYYANNTKYNISINENKTITISVELDSCQESGRLFVLQGFYNKLNA